MSEKIVIGPYNKGLRTDREPFVIDDDSFPTLINAYQWRGRVKRKRGTSFLCRLQRNIGTTDGAGNAVINILPIPIETGIVSFTIGADVFYDPGTTADPATQTLLTNSGGSGTLNRVTGVLTITGSIALTDIIYYPSLPVMGLAELFLDSTQYPGLIAFDTIYAYDISTAVSTTAVTDVSFYKNPPSATYPAYVAKVALTPVTWNGQDYQQFFTLNYQHALFVSNGVDVPFTGATIGMQFQPISNISITSVGPPAIVDITLNAASTTFVIGDFVFINEVVGIVGINWQSGYIIAVAGLLITVELPNATLSGAYVSGGIVQALTNTVVPGVDPIRWYDGNPENSSGLGWVNFMPPLSQEPFSIQDEIPAIYYLVGCKLMASYKDRILFLGAVIQTSTGNPIYTSDTVVYCQNGTAYYTASYTNEPSAAVDTPTSTFTFTGILTPSDETAHPAAFFEDQTGFGGFISAGTQQAITTCGQNEDTLILGFSSSLQTRFVYTGNDIIPFNFFIVSEEIGSASTFSTVNLDSGVITRGNRGFIITSQTMSKRFDLEILDQVFEIRNKDNGAERFTAQRDFINEWIYFTYTSNQESTTSIFPNQSLQYNYRDESWGIFNESYTTYGQFNRFSGNTWATIGNIYPTWADWNDPWSAGESTLLQPQIVGGNQQGFVLVRGIGTGEGTSLTIQNITGSQLTVPNHCLAVGDYIYITGVLGTGDTFINDKVFSVSVIVDKDNFFLNPALLGTVTYEGGGLITRMYVPQIQSKQFPTSWGISRKTRLGVQQYLFTATTVSQVTLLIFLSQNDDVAFNVEDNSGLIYSTIVYTCPESTNLGLTPVNTNLQMMAYPQTGVSPQRQIWHRVNTSLIGDTVQFGITLSDAQMRAVSENDQPIHAFSEIELHAAILDVSSSSVLA